MSKKASPPKKAQKEPKKPKALHPEVLPKEGGERSVKPKAKRPLDDIDPTENAEDSQDSEVENSDPEYEEPPEGEISGAGATEINAVEIDKSLETTSKAISPNDPLRRFMEEVRRYPLLSAEEEFGLAQRLKNLGDLEAAKRLVSANLRLVVKIAFEYRNFYSNVLDLIQEGNIGLMKAVSKFNPEKGARLGYYASWWIRSYILKYILDNFRLVKIGTTQAQKKLFYHLMREKERLEAQGLNAGPKLLAEKLDVREKDIVEMSQRLSSSGAEMSLDTPIDPESGTQNRIDYVRSHDEGADDQLVRDQLLKLLHDKLPLFEKILNEKEAKILHDRLLSEEPKTLQEVADLYGLTRERARQIEAKVIEKLRKFLGPEISG